MAAAAQIVEGMGADIVDVNMGCPVPKIAKHNAGCSLMREPAHARRVIAAMAKAVRIPVTVKMRAGWNDAERNAPTLARMVEDAGAAAVAVHGRTAAQSYSGVGRLGSGRARSPTSLSIPVFGSGDCVEPEQIVERLRDRASKACSSAAACCATRGFSRRPRIWPPAGRRATVTLADRRRFLLDYIELLMHERVHDPDERHTAGTTGGWSTRSARSRPTTRRGCARGSQFRSAVNSSRSLQELTDTIDEFLR